MRIKRRFISYFSDYNISIYPQFLTWKIFQRRYRQQYHPMLPSSVWSPIQTLTPRIYSIFSLARARLEHFTVNIRHNCIWKSHFHLFMSSQKSLYIHEFFGLVNYFIGLWPYQSLLASEDKLTDLKNVWCKALWLIIIYTKTIM